MASSSSIAPTQRSGTPVQGADRLGVSAIDLSLRLPVVFFLTSGVLWLLLGTVFSLITSHQLQSPGFLSDCEYITFGRLRPAEVNSFIYGWGFNAAFAVTFWLIARLSRTVLPNAGLLVIAGMFWNIGVTLGVGGILAGDSTSIEFLEIPGYATPLLFIAYVFIAAWAILAFRRGDATHRYVSQWYLFAALFWFPWFYSVAQVMLVFAPARGTVQSIVAAWYAANLLGIWFTPVGLAAIYYFLPKVLGRPISNYHLAGFGFWIFAVFASLTGASTLIGGPVPAWVQSASVGACLMLLVPIFIIGVNHHGTIFSHFAAVKQSVSLRFISFGAVSFSIAGVVQVALASRGVSELLHFTLVTQAHNDTVLYAFFSMVMFGAIYYLFPRVILKEWPSAMLINVHFFSAALGIVICLLSLYVGGIQQGNALNGSETPFLEIVAITKKYLFGQSLGGLLLLLGHFAFAVNFILILAKPRATRVTAADLFQPAPQMEVAT